MSLRGGVLPVLFPLSERELSELTELHEFKYRFNKSLPDYDNKAVKILEIPEFA
jgi:hypothetical protein